MPTSRAIWRPYTQEKTAALPLLLESAKGSHLHAKSGQKILDGISSWWLITHGHCHPAIVAAIQDQASRLDQVTFANFTHAPAEELAELLLRMTPPELTRVFFSDNGSTAVEAALKMALQARTQNGQPEKNKFLAFASSYHGDTAGAMSVSGDSAFNRPYKPELFEIFRAKHPTLSTASVDDFLDDFRAVLERHHASLAGVILEPLLQGAGGMIVWPEAAIRKVADLCREADVYLIFDEVMTGFGRTGKLFAMEKLGVTPDLVCLSKGLTGGSLPLAVTLAREEIYLKFLSTDKARMFFHGHSFTGNPISCAAAVASLKLFADPEVFAALERIEGVQRRGLETLAKAFPIFDPRVCGTVAAFEIKANENSTVRKPLERKTLESKPLERNPPEPNYLAPSTEGWTAAALKEGLFIRPLGNTVYLMPPFCVTTSELETAWEILRYAVPFPAL